MTEDDPRIEAVCRAMCVDRHIDPDERVGLDRDYPRDRYGRPLPGRDKNPTRWAPAWTSKNLVQEATEFLVKLDAALGEPR